jgi:hypothetical protein
MGGFFVVKTIVAVMESGYFIIQLIEIKINMVKNITVIPQRIIQCGI